MNSIVLGSPLISGIVATLIVLVVGDFASTFFYHVPQHVWGKLHLRTHHDRKRSYWDHAVLSRSPEVLLDGLLGAGLKLELDRGYLKTNDRYETSIKGIYGAGDIIGPPWLAHVASHEAIEDKIGTSKLTDSTETEKIDQAAMRGVTRHLANEQ